MRVLTVRTEMHSLHWPLARARLIFDVNKHGSLFAMETTHSSLLIRCQAQDPAALDKFARIYEPFINGKIRKRIFDHALSDEVSQEAIVFVLQRLPDFRRQRKGSFRVWLREVVANTGRRILQSRQRERSRTDPLDSAIAIDALDKLAVAESELAREWNREHAAYLIERLEREVIGRGGSHAERHWTIFKAMTLRETPHEDVQALAETHGISMARCYAIRGEVAAILQEIKDDWREFFETEDL